MTLTHVFLSQICLNNVPLIQINSSECPTCESLLSTGYGIETAHCDQLQHIRDEINSPFISLEKSIENMSPLLSLLESGLYVIADALCFPTDGTGNFFWNTPDTLRPHPGTVEISVPEADYAYVQGTPVYLYLIGLLLTHIL